MALQTANQFQVVTDFSQLGRGIQQGQQIAGQFQLSQERRAESGRKAEQDRVLSVVKGASDIQNIQTDDLKLNALLKRKGDLILKGLPTQDTDEVIQLFQEGKNDEANGLIDSVVNAGIQQGILKAPATVKQQPGFTLGNERFDAAGNLIATGKEAPITPLNQAKIDKLKAETENEKKTGISGDTPALDTLVSNHPLEVQRVAKAAFTASGGGDKGVKALQAVLKNSEESQRRKAAPETLKANFPKANEAELQELQAVVDSAKTTESGFKEAGKLRTKQRQVKKGKVFQTRAVELLDKILANPELNDVIGSRQGADRSPIIPFLSTTTFRSDSEAEAVADIEEAQDILTADNLDIMSGVLSETDIKIIANLAGGALNRKRGEASFRENVAKLRAKLAGELGLKEETDLTKLTDEQLLSGG